MLESKLYLRAIQGHINPALQDNVLLPEGLPSIFTTSETERIEVNSEPWFDSRRSQSQKGQTICILHCCESDG